MDRRELLRAARNRGLALAREFVLLGPREIDGASESAADGGFLFRPGAERA
jgi:hypothetical protein